MEDWDEHQQPSKQSDINNGLLKIYTGISYTILSSPIIVNGPLWCISEKYVVIGILLTNINTTTHLNPTTNSD